MTIAGDDIVYEVPDRSGDQQGNGEIRPRPPQFLCDAEGSRGLRVDFARIQKHDGFGVHFADPSGVQGRPGAAGLKRGESKPPEGVAKGYEDDGFAAESAVAVEEYDRGRILHPRVRMVRPEGVEGRVAHHGHQRWLGTRSRSILHTRTSLDPSRAWASYQIPPGSSERPATEDRLRNVTIEYR